MKAQTIMKLAQLWQAVTLVCKTMSDLNKHDRLQAIFDDLSKQDIENCETIGDIEKLVNEIYENELM